MLDHLLYISGICSHTSEQRRVSDVLPREAYAIYRLSNPKINRLLLLTQEVGEDLLADVKQLRDEFLSNHDDLEPILIDVRPKEEYEYDHIPGTWSIPLQELEQLYCRGRYCVYAAEAVKWFRSQGIKKIRSEDGVREWKELEPIFSW